MRDHPVLLVHGFASSFERNWREPGWVDLLQEAGREVIGVDLLGHGAAPKPHDPAAYDDMAARVIDVLPERAVDAVGFSMGGVVLLRLAARMPERFERLVIGGVGAGNMRVHDGEAVAKAILGQADEAEGGTLGRAFAQFAAGTDNDPEALAACMRRQSTPLTVEELGEIRSEVLIVLGDRDFVAPAEPLVDAIPNARLVTLKGADHFGTPKDFRYVDAALEFLDAVPG